MKYSRITFSERNRNGRAGFLKLYTYTQSFGAGFCRRCFPVPEPCVRHAIQQLQVRPVLRFRNKHICELVIALDGNRERLETPWLTRKMNLVAARWEESSSPRKRALRKALLRILGEHPKADFVPCETSSAAFRFREHLKQGYEKAAQIKRAALGHSPPFCLYFSASFFARSDDAVSTSPEISRVSSFVSYRRPLFPFLSGSAFGAMFLRGHLLLPQPAFCRYDTIPRIFACYMPGQNSYNHEGRAISGSGD